MLLRQDSRLLGSVLYPAGADYGLAREEFGLRRSLALLADDEYIIYECDEGDTLASVAHRFYSNAYMWWIIADVNELVDVWDLAMGTKLKIPKKDTLSRLWSRK